jgi:hypothetical protein
MWLIGLNRLRGFSRLPLNNNGIDAAPLLRFLRLPAIMRLM